MILVVLFLECSCLFLLRCFTRSWCGGRGYGSSLARRLTEFRSIASLVLSKVSSRLRRQSTFLFFSFLIVFVCNINC